MTFTPKKQPAMSDTRHGAKAELAAEAKNRAMGNKDGEGRIGPGSKLIPSKKGFPGKGR
jgi:hypothetical protein